MFEAAGNEQIDSYREKDDYDEETATTLHKNYILSAIKNDKELKYTFVQLLNRKDIPSFEVSAQKVLSQVHPQIDKMDGSAKALINTLIYELLERFVKLDMNNFEEDLKKLIIGELYQHAVKEIKKVEKNNGVLSDLEKKQIPKEKTSPNKKSIKMVEKTSSNKKSIKPLKYETCYLFIIWTQEEIDAGYDHPVNTFVLKTNHILEISEVFRSYIYENRDVEIKNRKYLKDDEEFENEVTLVTNNLPVINNTIFVSAARIDFQGAKMIV